MCSWDKQALLPVASLHLLPLRILPLLLLLQLLPTAESVRPRAVHASPGGKDASTHVRPPAGIAAAGGLCLAASSMPLTLPSEPSLSLQAPEALLLDSCTALARRIKLEDGGCVTGGVFAGPSTLHVLLPATLQLLLLLACTTHAATCRRRSCQSGMLQGLGDAAGCLDPVALSLPALLLSCCSARAMPARPSSTCCSGDDAGVMMHSCLASSHSPSEDSCCWHTRAERCSCAGAGALAAVELVVLEADSATEEAHRRNREDSAARGASSRCSCLLERLPPTGSERLPVLLLLLLWSALFGARVLWYCDTCCCC